MLTISRLSRWSIGYYNDTAQAARQSATDGAAAGGGLGEYYCEADTRTPTGLLVGDKAAVAERTGLDGAAVAGGAVDTAVAAAWLDDGLAPNGVHGRAFSKAGVHGFDLTFAAPKSVSLMRALTDPVADKVMAAAHEKAIAAMTYLHAHAGYTRVHNPVTGTKDLQRLAGVGGDGLPARNVAVRGSAPAHPRHRAQPPTPRRRPAGVAGHQEPVSRSQGRRHDLPGHAAPPPAHRTRFRVGPGRSALRDGRTRRGHKEDITAWSQRSTRLREWAAKKSGRRRRCADRRATGGRAEGHPPHQTGVPGMGGIEGAVAR